MTTFFKSSVLTLVSLSLASCGTYTPPIDYAYKDDRAAGDFVNDVSAFVRCEMRNAVHEIYKKGDPSYDWLKTWSGEVTLTLTITEKTTLTPGVITNSLIPTATQSFSNGTAVSMPQAFSLGLGGNYNNTATRTVAVTWFVLFKELLAEKAVEPCDRKGLDGLRSELKLKETLFMGLYTARLPGGVSQPFKTGGPLQNIQYTISFDVDTGASITPTLKLLRVAANPTGTFLGADRDRKDQLLITMGPALLSTEAKGRDLIPSALGPSSDVGTVHNIGRINMQLQP